jgi:hypothetical protein
MIDWKNWDWSGPPPTPEQIAEVAAANAALNEAAPDNVCRNALKDVLALSELYPAPTPEETALIDAQVVEALADFRALINPPVDVVNLATAVVSWRSTL